MFTPGIGPATEGLSGLALLACAHAMSPRPEAGRDESRQKCDASKDLFPADTLSADGARDFTRMPGPAAGKEVAAHYNALCAS